MPPLRQHRALLVYAVAVLLLATPLAAAPAPASARPVQLSTAGWPVSAGWPLTGSPVVVSEFAPPPKDWQAGHRGADLAARVGQSVHASAAGRVSFAGQVGGRPTVVITHGRLRTTYQPVSPSVRVGQRVRSGERIGRLATGSHCAQPCLHWGLKEGERYLDPTLLPTQSSTMTEPRLVAESAMAAALEAELAALAAASQSTVSGAGGTVETGKPGSPATRSRAGQFAVRATIPSRPQALETPRRHRLRRLVRNPDRGQL